LFARAALARSQTPNEQRKNDTKGYADRAR
jgi:hypothetical protein